MFNVGAAEMLVIALVALLVLGPDKLPEAARTAGKMMKQVRDISQGFQAEVRQAMNDVTSFDGAPDGVHPGAGPGPSLPPVAAEPEESADVADDTGGAQDDHPVDDHPVDDGDTTPSTTVRSDGPGVSFS